MMREGQDNFWEDKVDALGGPVMDGCRYRGRRYWLPEPTCRAATELARYYNLYLPHCGVPAEKRAVRNVLDAPDFAVDVLMFVSKLLDMGLGFVAGSQQVSPVAWAAVGNVPLGTLARVRFDCTEDLITHYIDDILNDETPCLPTSIFHQDHAVRKIMEIADSLKMPRGFVLAAAIMFLRDIIVNCGPDTEELACVFGNSWDSGRDADPSAWWFARAVLVTASKPAAAPSRGRTSWGWGGSTALVPVRELSLRDQGPPKRQFCRIEVKEDHTPGLAVAGVESHRYVDIDLTDYYDGYWY